jgi:hypothetical protein
LRDMNVTPCDTLKGSEGVIRRRKLAFRITDAADQLSC